MSKQSDLFGGQGEWVGMPEFVQERKREYAKIIVRFRNQEDLDKFAEIVGQKLNRKSQATWFPELRNGEIQGRGKYVDES